ncbi:MAG: NAD-dependent epimerase/dehydratase family protein [Gemmatimonadales bacterium]
MRFLVTGADGFVGAWLCHRLLARGDEVWGTHRAGGPSPGPRGAPQTPGLRWLGMELSSDGEVRGVAEGRYDAVIHLAGMASGAEARRVPAEAWLVNAAGTARVLEALASVRHRGLGDPLVLVISTGEVYGRGEPRPRTESDESAPCSPYAASKLGAEVAALEVARRTGLRVVVARPFAHTGPGQRTEFVVAALAARLREAAARPGPKPRLIRTGRLDVTRDFLDVRDVVEAYLGLVAAGTPGTIYNVASGVGQSLESIFTRLAALVGVDAAPEQDASLVRTADIDHLVGDPARLVSRTGWQPRIPFDQTLQDLLNAEAH